MLATQAPPSSYTPGAEGYMPNAPNVPGVQAEDTPDVEIRGNRLLGDLQGPIMNSVWKSWEMRQEGTSVRDVADELDKQGRLPRNRAYTTLATVMNRLVQSGFLAVDKSGSYYVYFPRISRTEYRRSVVRAMREQLILTGIDEAEISLRDD